MSFTFTYGVYLCTKGWFPPLAQEQPRQQQAQVGHQGFQLLPAVESRTTISCQLTIEDIQYRLQCSAITIIYLAVSLV